MDDWLLYGANGYTGRLIAQLAVEQGHRPVLAGRDRAAVAALAGRLGLEYRAFDLTDAEMIWAGLSGMAAVLHCAGPFAVTSAPMVAGCLATGTHYLDVTGEIAVLEAVYALDAQAREAGVVLLPAVGFDVVPTDCLAGLLAAALPGATSLELAFVAGGGLSPGTFATSLRGMAAGNQRRVDGELRRIPMGGPRRVAPLPSGPATVTAIPWGDLASAWRSTGIPNITTYTRVTGPAWAAGPAAAAMRSPLLQRLVRRLAAPSGPDESRRAGTRAELWGEVRNPAGDSRTATVTTPNAYALTAHSALAATLQTLTGKIPPGAHTPATALTPAFLATLPDVHVSAVA